MCDANMITNEKMQIFQDIVIVIDDMGDTLNKDIAYYFAEGRHKNIQIVVECHKPAQIINTARMSCDTLYITTYNGSDLYKNFNITYECRHDFLGIINDLYSSYYNCTDRIASELRYGTIK